MSGYTLSFVCPVERTDEVFGRLYLAGAEGWREDEGAGGWRLDIDWETRPAAEAFRDWIVGALGAIEVSIVAIDRSVDWIFEAARGLEPFPVGDKLWVDPTADGAGVAPDGRLRLHIPPERAFGVGTHESTRAMLEALDAEPPLGRRVLDVGTGSGILAFAAAALGAAESVAFDDDAEAIFCAARNARRHPGVRIFAGGIEALRPAATFEVVFANLTAPVLKTLMPQLAAHAAPGARMHLAGILAAESEEVEAAARAAGFGAAIRRPSGEWVSFEVRRG